VAHPCSPPHRLWRRPGDHDPRGNEIEPGARVPGDQKPGGEVEARRQKNAREEADRRAREETRVTAHDAKGKPEPEEAPPPWRNWTAARHQWFRAAGKRAASMPSAATSVALLRPASLPVRLPSASSPASTSRISSAT